MKRQLLYILVLSLIWSCQIEQKGQKKENLKKSETDFIKMETAKQATFEYEEFEIQKGQLGDIKIGMTITEAENEFDGLRKETGQATSFGYGGGSPAYLYYDNESVAFGLIPTLNTDTVLFIIATSPKLVTTNGLNPNSTVKEISNEYPGIKVNQDLMNGWEYISDTTNNWKFVFKTNNEKKVGEYPELEIPSELKNMDIKADWITIK